MKGKVSLYRLRTGTGSFLALEENSCMVRQKILMVKKDKPPIIPSVITTLGIWRTASAMPATISKRIVLVIKVVLRGSDGLLTYVNDWLCF